MQRDLDLIRHVLLTIEASSSDRLFIEDFQIDNYTPQEISYHLDLLLDTNYIEATPKKAIGAPYTQFIVKRLTAFGHDYLDAIRDDSIWAKTKTKLPEIGGSTSLDVIKTVASSIALKALGL